MPSVVSYPRLAASRQQTVADTFIITAITIAALYAGRAVFIPLALAILLAFILAPAIMFLRRWRFPYIVATVTVLLIFLGSLAGVGAVITGQVTNLVEELPKYERTLRDKISVLRSAGVGSRAMDRAGETLQQLRNDLEKPEQSRTTTPAPESRQAPQLKEGTPDAIPVEIREPAPTPLQQVNTILNILLAPLATTGVVILLLIFILLEREDFRDRMIKLLGSDDLDRSTSALNESAKRLSKYLFTLTILNVAFGSLIAGGLWLIGVPSPVLWGILAAIMRFVPFIGSLIAAALPILLAAAVDPGWSMVGSTFALFALGEPIMGQLIEPVIQGRSTGLSTLAILVSTAFWTLLWGPIGLLLAVPLTLVLVAVGRHVESLSFFNFLLSDQPALSPAERFYQRILAGDADEAAEQAIRHLKEMDLARYYDDIVRSALVAAARDAERGRFDSSRLSAINASVQEVVTILADEDPVSADARPAKDAAVICIGARTAIDDAGAHILASLLVQRGISAAVVAPNDWRQLTDCSPRAICVGAFAGSRRLALAVRVVHRLRPDAAIIVGMWHTQDEQQPSFDASIAASADIVTTFEAAIKACERITGKSSADQKAA